MAQEITLSQFERNAARANRNGMARSYNTIVAHQKEYIPYPPLSATPKLMFEVTVDKDYVDKLIEMIKKDGFEFFGATNYFYLEEFINQYEANPTRYNVKPDMVDALKKDLALMKEKNTDSKDAPDDDKVFYFMPYNDGTTTLYEFIKSKKDELSKFAKDNDITIMMKITGFNNQISGFLGFNFFDADKAEENVVIDYAARVTVGVDFKSKPAVYTAALYLNSIGNSEAELYDADVNTHIVTEKAVNAK